nr:hypothetical protein [Tanacetum cinerariifolium]
MGKDGNPLKPMQMVQISDKEADTLNTQNPKSSTVVDNVVDSTNSTMGLKPSVNATVQPVAIPLEAVESVSSRFVNTLYGYFIGNRPAFPLVENYVKNAWAKYGLKRIQLHEEFFLFQFDIKDGMERKAEVKKAPVWVKLHHVPTVAYSEIRLSHITTQIGTPIMLDTYISNMCVSSWGRSTYARALVEISAEVDLVDELVIAIPVGKDMGHSLATVTIEYEWRPPRCSTCMIFDHTSEKCPKRSKELQTEPIVNDGFEVVKKKKNRSKNKQHKQVDGVKLSKPALNLHYRRVEKVETLKSSVPSLSSKDTNVENLSRTLNKEIILTSNSFTALMEEEEDIWGDKAMSSIVNDSDSEEVDDELIIEGPNNHSNDNDWTSNGAWCSKGDFNAALTFDDMVTGASTIDISMQEFKECVDNIEVIDVHNTGLKYTWIQKPKGSDGVLKKIDRVMANIEFFNVFLGGHAIFQPYRLSDHSPAVLCLPSAVQTKPKPFKFTNILRDLDRDRLNVILRVEEALYVQAFNEAILLEERFLKHKAKVNWLRDGDSNSAYFHKSMKNYISRNRIDVITNSDGVAFENEKDSEAFVSHYEVFLGQPEMAAVSSSDEGAHSKTVKVGTKELLRSSFASKIRNVDGKILGKDGRPMRKAIRFQQPVKVGEIVSNNQVTNPSNSFNCGSFAYVVQHNALRKVVKVSELRNKEIVHGAAVAIPLEAVKEVSARFENTLYGYFVGKKLAFPLVENYVKNTWIKFGLDRVMNKNGFFYFQFSTRDGMEKVIENGPWLIWSVSPILNVWTPNAQVKKDDIKSDYARALIQVSADVELTKSFVVAIPFLDNTGHSLETVDVEYEWTPPRCGTCCVFDHNDDNCLKKVHVNNTNAVEVSEDGFTTVVNRKKKGKGPIMVPKKSVGGFKVDNLQKEDNGVKLKNLFEKLNEITVVVDPSDDNMNVIYTPIDDDGSESAWRRGLNRAPKQTEVRQVVNENQLSVCIILESHVDISSLAQVCSKVFKYWEWTSNANMCTKGCRIILGWNLDVVNVMVLSQTNQVVRGQPWTLLGDFNVALNLEDYHLGPSSLNSAMVDFKDCVAKIEVMDVNSSGLHFTWNQKPRGGGGVLKKLDRIMGNVEFFDAYPGAHAIFHPYRISDHSPSVLNIPELPITKPRPFKFFNFVAHKPKFLEVVANHWSSNVAGQHMYQLKTKLKCMKKHMRKLVHDHGNLHERVDKLRVELDEIQKALDKSPSNFDLRDEEAMYVNAFNEAKLDEERFLKQKAKIDWLDVGDSNSAYFHKEIKSHNQWIYEGLFNKKISEASCSNMVRHISNEEIKSAMFSIGDDKSPGPDGYTPMFFKRSWDIVGYDVCNAVSTPSHINDFRPISCCNVIYKCISKILTNRIIEGIKEVVSDNQLAFVSGRRITDNILITQELMHGYHLDKGTPRCAFKFDIRKAYDTVDWKFLEVILWQFGFPNLMIRWIMACVTTASFSISINRDIHGFFKGKRGLRQGDPLSPYLFTLFGPCNVCFADDLFIFARGDVNSAKVIMESLDEFKNVSGLVPSLPKITTFFCNVPSHVKQAILQIMPFSEGTLPVIYLGVPIISSRLFNKDCKFLMEKAKNRIGDWKNKSLSYAGRLQLCKSVIASMHVYWASVLIIPKGILLDIEQLIRSFLWCNGELKRGKAKVAWHDICIPKKEGGLGIRSLEMFNIALMTTHIWNLVSNKDSIWGRSFWDVPVTSRLSWGWRKLLQLRDIVRLFFWSQIGSGREVSIWFDRWCVQCPLRRFLSARDISREGFLMLASVKDMISNESWLWPQSWLLKAPILGQLVVPSLDPNKPDLHYWRDSNGVMRHFLVKAVWEEIRPCGPKVHWFRIVWFSHNVPATCFSSLADSHEHLFYECSFSSKVWCSIRHLAAMDNVSHHLQDIVSFLQPIATKRTAISIIGHLLFATSSYFLWIERNNRLFKGLKRSPEDVHDIILVTELNHTIIALVLKVASPSCVNDFRPISCCNVLFKCISKIIANCIKESLKTLVSPNQSPFVPGRNDLFLFVHGDTNSARVIMDALDEFKQGFGLTLSLPKSTAYFCNVLNYIKLSILQILPFEEGSLPVKYLGVPLVLSRWIYHYCKELIEKVRARVDNLKNKLLSIAARL